MTDEESQLIDQARFAAKLVAVVATWFIVAGGLSMLHPNNNFAIVGAWLIAALFASILARLLFREGNDEKTEVDAA